MAISERSFEQLAETAISALRTAIATVDLSDTQLQQARLAAGSLASFTRYVQTQGAREAARFAMAERVSADPEVLRAYVATAMPDHGILKALPTGKK